MQHGKNVNSLKHRFNMMRLCLPCSSADGYASSVALDSDSGSVPTEESDTGKENVTIKAWHNAMHTMRDMTS